MKVLKVFSFVFIVCLDSYSQDKIQGFITEISSDLAIADVSIYNSTDDIISTSNSDGYFEINIIDYPAEIIFYTEGFNLKTLIVSEKPVNEVNVSLESKIEELDEVIVRANRKKIFQIKRMKDFEQTRVFAGKKNEVILLELSMANLASNNARQVYSQIPGLNIYQNDDAGLQLNIGGRGLNPNRTANFNTRQNGYDISADALGYPESYYTPPAEALSEIEILRGAASLQYGTQFGGLINFVMKKPNVNKKLELITRNSIGSKNLITNFTSVSINNKKLSFYGFSNFKKGDGFRKNSEFESFNSFGYINYTINKKSNLSIETTYLTYLAHQAGGLSDKMFSDNPFQSNRERNWFEVEWLLYNLKYNLNLNNKTNFSFSFFGLEAKRNALGFRTNRVDQIDNGEERDLIKGEFSNFGFEKRLLKEYKIKNLKSIFLLGFKYYKSNSKSQQGPGSANETADFSFDFNTFPDYVNQSRYEYPNSNFALFGENIIYFSENLYLTPGFRYENIKTQSDGFYRKINLDAAGNTILNERFDGNDVKKRNFILLGLGLNYKVNKSIEFYSNISQNYRSVTFADISITNPAYAISPDIDDEKGFTADMGFRGNFQNKISYDTSVFTLSYKDRIGFVQKVFNGNVKSERGNVGNAIIYGVETLIDFNLNKLFFKKDGVDFNFFINYSFINSEYLESDEVGIEGKVVEFVPKHNLKSGFKFGYKNFAINWQTSYLSSQFTDSSNAIEGNLSGVIGQIPSYIISDLSTSIIFKKWKIECGINNIFDENYFTRRATGYPGPGIIPSAPRNIYLTIELKF
tara:strand:- start:987 stop:3404 length:2418 start_codon:yes stop_codon:yes gene_type:complete